MLTSLFTFYLISMKRILLLVFLLSTIFTSKSQNLSFTCPRDTVLSCGATCITLTARFPDIKSIGDNYSLINATQITQCFPLIPPDVIGPSTFLDIDDTYSDVIPIGFNFPFYGSIKTALVVGANGYLTFDLGRANAGSIDWSLTPGNFPNSSYDRELIAGPWHDLNPALSSSPTQQIKYNVIGTAPNRKWVLSYYRVPLFGSSCVGQIENTHQTILHESTGIIEVFIKDKEICTGWNSGKAMVGLQNIDYTKAIIAPGRAATDPPWGSIGMNETWRFIPTGGAPLYRSVELLDGSGTVIATGDTTRINANTFEASFPNICPPSNVNTIYVVKTTYQKIDDPLVNIYSLDTINVIRQNSLPLNTVISPTSCGTNSGSVTVNITSGTTPFQYSVDGGALQNSNILGGLSTGPHTIYATDATGCDSTFSIIIPSSTTVPATHTSTATSCPGVNNGTVTITANGTAPYNFILTGPGGPYTGSLPLFTGLQAGNYSLTFTDNAGCTGSIPSIIVPLGTAPTGSATLINATSCNGASDGSFTANAGGTAPHNFILTGPNGTLSQALPLFTGLISGTYSLSFTDNVGCTGTIPNIIIPSGPTLTASAAAGNTSCPGVNNGTVTVSPLLASGTFYTLNPGAVTNTSGLFPNLAPGTYTVSFITPAGCAGTAPAVTVNPGPSLIASATKQDPVCNNINDGTISITPQPATGAPFNVILTGPGGPYNLSGPAPVVFTGLAPGTYNYTFTDANGCTGTGPAVTLVTNAPLAATITNVQPLCNGDDNGSFTVTTTGGVAPYTFTIDGGASQTLTTLPGIGAGPHLIRITDNVGCIKDTIVTLAEPTLLSASASSTPSGCGGTDGTITVTGTGGTAPYLYSIDNGGYYQSNATIQAPAVGPYPDIRVKDANGCIANASTTVILIDNMFLDAGPADTICAEQSLVLSPSTNPETNSFSWTPNSDINNDTLKNPTVTPLQTVTYVLYARWAACSRTDSVTITVLRKPVPDAGPDVTICYNDSTLLTGNATNLSGTVNFVWSPASLVNDDSSAVTIAKPDSTQLYILTVTDNYGCNFSVKDSVLITMRPPVPAFAGNDTMATLNMPHQLTATGGTQYVWSPTGPLSSPFSPTPLATITEDTKFTVVVTDIAGCVGYDTVFLKAYEGPAYYLPNAFTPNGDGLNDIFRAVPVGIAKTEWFRIFNRYGDLVFETNQWLKGWDGNYRGKKQPAGVYVWIIKGTDKFGMPVNMKGTVMLIQ